jgi:hypothetical protein
MNRKIRIKGFSLVLCCLALAATFTAPKACAEPVASREYQIKAAFIYNFIKFVDWPKEKVPDQNTPIIIGIIGKNPFQDAFEPLQEKEAKDKKVIIRQLEGFVDLEKAGKKQKDQPHPSSQDIQKCHLLFICPSEAERLNDIIASVKGRNILTVADTQGFLEAGGIINFVTEEKKVRFEINAIAAKRAKIDIRSQLLRLAKKVIKEDGSEGNKDG